MGGLIELKVVAAQIIGFVLLWILLARYLFRPIMGMLNARQEDIKNAYADAENARTSANQLKTELEQRISGIEAEARTRIQAAVKEAQDTKDEIIAEARTRAEEVLRRGQEDLAREKTKTLAELREEVVNISISAAGKLIEESLDDAKHRQLVGDFIDRIGVAK
jgi:F-type H+-transporting ATPase subunit b